MRKFLLFLVFCLCFSTSFVRSEEVNQDVSKIDNEKVETNQEKPVQNNKQHNICFANAVIKGDFDLVKTYVQADYDVNGKYGSVPLIFFPVQKNNNEMLKLLLDLGANPNSIYLSTSVAMLALEKDNNEALDILLKKGANVNIDENGCSLLITAIYLDKIESVKVLLENKVDVNQIAYNKKPINVAVQKKRLEITELLLKNGAKTDDETFRLLKKSKNKQLKMIFEQYK